MGVLWIFLLAFVIPVQTERIGEAHQGTSCDAIVKEGTTAQIRFRVEPWLFVSKSFSANIMRSDGSDVTNCDRMSPIKCTIPEYLEKFYNVDLSSNAFILSIGNVTRDFEDTYTLDAYANNKPQMRVQCRLIVKGIESCVAPAVEEGGTGEVRFVFRARPRPGDSFRVNIRRAHNHDEDIVVCNNSQPGCTVLDGRYATSGIVSNSLTLSIPKASPDMEDIYMLQTTVNGISSFPTSCFLKVEIKGQQNKGKDSGHMDMIINILSGVLLIGGGVALIAIYIFILRRKPREPEQGQPVMRKLKLSLKQLGESLLAPTAKESSLTTDASLTDPLPPRESSPGQPDTVPSEEPKENESTVTTDAIPTDPLLPRESSHSVSLGQRDSPATAQSS